MDPKQLDSPDGLTRAPMHLAVFARLVARAACGAKLERNGGAMRNATSDANLVTCPDCAARVVRAIDAPSAAPDLRAGLEQGTL